MSIKNPDSSLGDDNQLEEREEKMRKEQDDLAGKIQEAEQLVQAVKQKTEQREGREPLNPDDILRILNLKRENVKSVDDVLEILGKEDYVVSTEDDKEIIASFREWVDENIDENPEGLQNALGYFLGIKKDEKQPIIEPEAKEVPVIEGGKIAEPQIEPKKELGNLSNEEMYELFDILGIPKYKKYNPSKDNKIDYISHVINRSHDYWNEKVSESMKPDENDIYGWGLYGDAKKKFELVKKIKTILEGGEAAAIESQLKDILSEEVMWQVAPTVSQGQDRLIAEKGREANRKVSNPEPMVEGEEEVNREVAILRKKNSKKELNPVGEGGADFGRGILDEQKLEKPEEGGKIEEPEKLATGPAPMRNPETIDSEKLMGPEKPVEQKEVLESEPRKKAKEFFLKQDKRPTFEGRAGRESLMEYVKYVDDNIDEIRSLVALMGDRKDLSDDERGLIQDLKRHNYIEKAWGNLSDKEQKKHGNDKFIFVAFLAAKRFKNITTEVEDNASATFEELKNKDDEFKAKWVAGGTSEGFDLTEDEKPKKKVKQPEPLAFGKNKNRYVVTGGAPEQKNEVTGIISSIRKEHMDALKKGEDYYVSVELDRLPESLRADVANMLAEDEKRFDEAREKRNAKAKRRVVSKKKGGKPKKPSVDEEEIADLRKDLGEILGSAVEELEKEQAERIAREEKEKREAGFIHTTKEEIKDFGKTVAGLHPRTVAGEVKEAVGNSKESIKEAGRIVDGVRRIGDEYIPAAIAEPETPAVGIRKVGRVLARPFRRVLGVVLGAAAITSRAAGIVGEGSADSIEEAVNESTDELRREKRTANKNRKIDKVIDEDNRRIDEEETESEEKEDTETKGAREWHWEALDTTGGEISGTMIANSEDEVQRKVRGKGYFITRITAGKEVVKKPWWEGWFGGGAETEEKDKDSEEFLAEMDKKDIEKLGKRIASEKPDSFEELIELLGPDSFYDKKTSAYSVKKINQIKDIVDKFEKKEITEKEAQHIIWLEIQNVQIKVLMDKLEEIVDKKVKVIKGSVKKEEAESEPDDEEIEDFSLPADDNWLDLGGDSDETKAEPSKKEPVLELEPEGTKKAPENLRDEIKKTGSFEELYDIALREKLKDGAYLKSKIRIAKRELERIYADKDLDELKKFREDEFDLYLADLQSIDDKFYELIEGLRKDIVNHIKEKGEINFDWAYLRKVIDDNFSTFK